MRKVVIVSGVRTAVGTFGGGLKDVSAVTLGALVMRGALQKAGLRPVADERMLAAAADKLKDQGVIPLETAAGHWDDNAQPVAVDEVIMGQVLQAGLGQNPARQAMISAGLSKETPAMTVNKVCGSGLKAIALGAQSIMTGQADVVVAGGQENMSRAPMALPKARWGHRMELTGVGEIQDLMVFDGLYEIFYGYHMGMTAENIAALYNISRQEQDELGVLSHQRAMAAIKSGLFAQEIVPVTIKGRKGDTVVDTDERPMETDMAKMAKLRPAFKKDGTVTAGNASGINDGAAAVVLMSEDKAKALGLTPIVSIRSFASGGLDPAYMGLGPVPAVRKALDLAGMTLQDIEMIELNEAFASQAIGCMKELDIAYEKPNELGSGISLGHPIGATGGRQMVSGMYQMQRKGYATGLITMCIGGGMGMAMVVER
ncbi:thiolase family protein [Desulfatitalea alkaliphila]|uniref:Acetyl-CoA C-acetyltransferase n=1 Tax=Desulfatitalea alkaliphila TaxID=2929485 RepID=A0AA41R4K5_9BACT|nr:acetyl-CoA C-acetyltransferase [Desulfatitalea alkaliphila]MCJ8500780.1 acetyl-CoA C-acetyltransferase [Desulfatitalea alkaliphila]